MARVITIKKYITLSIAAITLVTSSIVYGQDSTLTIGHTEEYGTGWVGSDFYESHTEQGVRYGLRTYDNKIIDTMQELTFLYKKTKELSKDVSYWHCEYSKAINDYNKLADMYNNLFSACKEYQQGVKDITDRISTHINKPNENKPQWNGSNYKLYNHKTKEL